MRLAKIVATLGPASSEPEMIKSLIQAGVNVFRLNFSHAQHEALRVVIQTIRNTSQTLNLPVAILGDLQGPKFRVGEFEGHHPILLEEGKTIRFVAEKAPGNAQKITTNTPQIVEELRIGDDVLLNDGLLALRVEERISQAELVCRVISGGILGEKKGINVPGLQLKNLPALTEKDKPDALFILEQQLDFIALSFVRSASDIDYLRGFLQEHAQPGQELPMIVAKIEKPQALDEIDAIIATTDAVMVARGDLGVELKPEGVPIVQKRLIAKANAAEKPVITATQMLESMIYNSTPTRAEVSDVANAVYDGSDALMLSGETAMGKFPIESVRMMGRIIEESESHFLEERRSNPPAAIEGRTYAMHEVIAQSACYAAKKARTKAIVVLSVSGQMARRISKRKPPTPILALTPQPNIFHRLCLYWGVFPLKISPLSTSSVTLQEAHQVLKTSEKLGSGDAIVFCAGKTELLDLSNTMRLLELP
jgi:pyruvate kinase